jgi:hypothetical protein
MLTRQARGLYFSNIHHYQIETVLGKSLNATVSRSAIFRQQVPLPGKLLQQTLGNREVALVTAGPAHRLVEGCKLQIDALQVERRD